MTFGIQFIQDLIENHSTSRNTKDICIHLLGIHQLSQDIMHIVYNNTPKHSNLDTNTTLMYYFLMIECNIQLIQENINTIKELQKQ